MMGGWLAGYIYSFCFFFPLASISWGVCQRFISLKLRHVLTMFKMVLLLLISRAFIDFLNMWEALWDVRPNGCPTLCKGKFKKDLFVKFSFSYHKVLYIKVETMLMPIFQDGQKSDPQTIKLWHSYFFLILLYFMQDEAPLRHIKN